MRDDRRTSMEGERLSDNSGGGSGGGGGGGGGIIDGNGSRPLSQTSSEMDTLGPLQPVKHREKAKLQVIFSKLINYLCKDIIRANKIIASEKKA